MTVIQVVVYLQNKNRYAQCEMTNISKSIKDTYGSSYNVENIFFKSIVGVSNLTTVCVYTKQYFKTLCIFHFIHFDQQIRSLKNYIILGPL